MMHVLWGTGSKDFCVRPSFQGLPGGFFARLGEGDALFPPPKTRTRLFHYDLFMGGRQRAMKLGRLERLFGNVWVTPSKGARNLGQLDLGVCCGFLQRP